MAAATAKRAAKQPRQAARPPAGRRVLLGCLLFLAIFLTADTALRWHSQATVTALQTSETPIASIATAQGARLRSEILPATAMDGRWWVIHAEEFLRGSSWRVRSTSLDNAPNGREVHWSSGLIWLLGGLAHFIALLEGKAALDCVPAAAFWSGPILLALSLGLLGIIITKRYGPGLAGPFLLIFTTSTLVYQCFRAGEADHHGLVCTLATASVLCLTATGGGKVRNPGAQHERGPSVAPTLDDAKKWFRWSGIFGGAALWVSAATFIPIMVGCAIGAVLAGRIPDSRSQSAPGLWRSWSGAGCLASLGFYLLEYFPNHLGWRLEVNHPVYALAWLGAGDLLSRVSAWSSGGRLVERSAKDFATCFASLGAVAVPLVLIAGWPDRFFWVSDPFLLQLHAEFIQEFQGFFKMLADRPIGGFFEAMTWPIFVATGSWWLLRRGMLTPPWRSALAFASAPALVMQMLAFAQVRWSILSTSLWLVCVLILLAAFFAQPAPRSRLFLGLFGTAVAVASLTFPLLALLSLANVEKLQANLPKAVIPTVLARDLAHRLVEASPSRLPVVLAGPSTSTELTYYGGVRTLGTLYWENRDGLKSAAHLFASVSEQDAREQLRAAGVSHVLIASWDQFSDAYAKLLRKVGEPIPASSALFFPRLLAGEVAPDWLRPLYYPIPPAFGIREEKVRLFEFVEHQSPAEALHFRGIFALQMGDFAKAEHLFRESLALAPGNTDARQILEQLQKARSATPSPSR